jgi:hypothetical protein
VVCALAVGGERFERRVGRHDARHVTPLFELASRALAAVGDGAWTYALAPSTRAASFVYCVRTADAERVVDRLGFG